MTRPTYRSLVVTMALVITATTPGLRAQGSEGQGQAVTITRQQFDQFKWIAGRWHGIGFGPLAAVGAFYEEYVVVDDSTIHMRTMTDSTFRVAEDSTRFEFRGGQLRAVPARGSTRPLMRVAGDSMHWGGGVTYVRLTNDLWRALIPLRGSGDNRPFYELRRAGR